MMTAELSGFLFDLYASAVSVAAALLYLAVRFIRGRGRRRRAWWRSGA